jgi:hypothetical protein
MFIIHVTVGNLILERSTFWNLKEASNYAREAANNKIWEFGDNQIYYGDVQSFIYKPKLCVTSDHIDEHILSFSPSKRNRRNVMRPARG